MGRRTHWSCAHTSFQFGKSPSMSQIQDESHSVVGDCSVQIIEVPATTGGGIAHGCRFGGVPRVSIKRGGGNITLLTSLSTVMKKTKPVKPTPPCPFEIHNQTPLDFPCKQLNMIKDLHSFLLTLSNKALFCTICLLHKGEPLSKPQVAIIASANQVVAYLLRII